MVPMKTSVGWSCPSPPLRRKELLKGKETACRHAYKQDTIKRVRRRLLLCILYLIGNNIRNQSKVR